MRRVAVTSVDSLARHRTIVDHKKAPGRSNLESHKVAIESRISDLLTNGPFALAVHDLGHTCGGKECAPCLRADLDLLWSSETTELAALRAELFAELRKVPCPYCGINVARTLDHYLPRTAFPEFAANLIPCCERCNTLKRSLVPTQSDRLLHPVIDPVNQMLFDCRLDVTTGVPAPAFSVNVGAADAVVAGFSAVCAFHFDRLELDERFKEAMHSLVADFLNALVTFGVPQGKNGAVIARVMARSCGGERMPNNPQAMVYLAIAEWMDTFG